MLLDVDLKQRVDKKIYKQRMKELKERLVALQLEMIEKKVPVVILFEGWSASGKGTFISKIVDPLDPRYFNVYTMDKISEDAALRPFLWTYAIKMPEKGRMVIFDKSWQRISLPEGSARWRLTEEERDGFMHDVNAFEKQLLDDGALIVKFFLHISKDEQKKRFGDLLKLESTRWRVDESDWKQNKEYEKYKALFSDMIEQTEAHSPWNIIEAESKNFATLKIYETLVSALEEKMRGKGPALVPPEYAKAEIPLALTYEGLDRPIDDNEYEEKLDYYQNLVSQLGYKLYTKRKSVVIVYEGWDAAGKGGNIKRITEKLDPRGYEVIPIASPSIEELNHQYLWRFWKKIPKDGHVGIFDRSWYGRVMVERVEGFCSDEEWQRAFQEINDFERHLANNGTVILKFWLQIDKDEQLDRFEARRQNPLKQHKITDEDWRNREKWDAYEEAVNEMIWRTNARPETDFYSAPWIVIESNNKKYARIKTLKIVTDTLKKALE